MSEESEPKPKGAQAPLTSVGVAAWGLVMFVGCRLIEIFLEAHSMAGTVGQAVLVEWGSSRIGVVWSHPGSAMTTATIQGAPKAHACGRLGRAPQVARRVAIGAAIGLGAAGVLFGVLAATRGISLKSVTNVEVSVLAIGLATAVLSAWRDELLLHGVVLRALELTSVGPLGRVLACGLTSAGAALGRSDATARTVFVAALLGVVFGALWIHDRGAWQPCAANAGFRFATGTLLSGGIVHGRLADDAWAGGSAGILGGTAAVIALAPVAVLTLGWIAQRMSPSPAPIR